MGLGLNTDGREARRTVYDEPVAMTRLNDALNVGYMAVGWASFGESAKGIYGRPVSC